MSRKSKYLLYAFLILLVGSAVYKFYVFVIERDFIITSEISCDPVTESCFVWDCDPEEDEECDRTPYKYISKNAKNIEVCNPYSEEECEELSCSLGEEDCEITVCSEEELGDEEICVFGEEYVVTDDEEEITGVETDNNFVPESEQETVIESEQNIE